MLYISWYWNKKASDWLKKIFSHYFCIQFRSIKRFFALPRHPLFSFIRILTFTICLIATPTLNDRPSQSRQVKYTLHNMSTRRLSTLQITAPLYFLAHFKKVTRQNFDGHRLWAALGRTLIKSSSLDFLLVFEYYRIFTITCCSCKLESSIPRLFGCNFTKPFDLVIF